MKKYFVLGLTLFLVHGSIQAKSEDINLAAAASVTIRIINNTIEIGSFGQPGHPRLIWFEDCMIHGWHALVDPVLDIRSPVFARINDNTFRIDKGQCAIELTDADSVPAGPVAVSGNFINGSEKSLKLGDLSGHKVSEQGNIFLNWIKDREK